MRYTHYRCYKIQLVLDVHKRCARISFYNVFSPFFVRPSVRKHQFKGKPIETKRKTVLQNCLRD